MDLDEGLQGLWRPEELASIWRQQLLAAMQFDLSTAIPNATEISHKTESTQPDSLKTFGDLLHCPDPSLELLILVKNFGKIRRLEAEGRRKRQTVTQDAEGQSEWILPEEIATVLYFASIAAALIKCRERITSLDDRKLREGLEWALARKWTDPPTQLLFENSLKLLKSK